MGMHGFTARRGRHCSLVDPRPTMLVCPICGIHKIVNAFFWNGGKCKRCDKHWTTRRV